MSTAQQPPNPQQRKTLDDIEINSENTALNVLVGFLHVAQKRGAFEVNESAKIHEAIKWFQRPATERSAEPTNEVATTTSLINLDFFNLSMVCNNNGLLYPGNKILPGSLELDILA